MNKENTEKLYKKYTGLYMQKDLNMQQTAMCWGFSCGDGWYNIVDSLSRGISNHVDCLNCEGFHDYKEKPEDHVRVEIQAVQVKEKYGTLRFYVNQSDDYVDGLIEMAELMSAVTCEACGSPGEINSGGWRMVRCDNCNGKYKKMEGDNVV